MISVILYVLVSLLASVMPWQASGKPQHMIQNDDNLSRGYGRNNKDYESYRSITEQLKFGAIIPPSVNSIKSMQRKFL